MKCRACHFETKQFFSLGKMPLVNSFLKQSQIKHEKKYDLSVCFCQKCYLVQLKKIVPPEDLFRNYIYFSSTSKSFLEHCEKTAIDLTSNLKLDSQSLVLEIASNDGAQLQFFKKLGINVLGVDPAKNIAKVANKKGIKTIPEFFNYRFAKQLKAKKIDADLIFGANVLAHVPKIVDFVKGVELILKDDGTAIFEFPYLKGLMENKFDTIYHEHVFYYSLIALQNIFSFAKLEIYDVEITEVQGGSLRIYAAHKGVFPINMRVKDLKIKEIKNGYNKIDQYYKIEKKVKKLKQNLIKVIINLKKKGKKIAAYSAPAKGNILLNYFNIGENYLEFIVDKSSAKQGYYTPGTHMLVEKVEKIFKDKPDYLLILCWNISDEVIQQMNEFTIGGGKYIIPIPQVTIK